MKIKQSWILWIFRLAIVACFAFNYAAVFDRKMDMNGDNYVYYQLARSLAQGHGYVSEIGPVPEPHMHFPPGYPAFMSLFYHIFPDNVVALKMLNGFLLLISILLLFRIVRKTIGHQGHWIALAGCLLTVWHPELLRWATILMSEMLYTTLTLAIIALCLELDFEKLRRKDIRQILLLAGLCLLTAALYFVRTMGISLILAVALTFLILGAKAFLRRKKEVKSWTVPLLASALVLLSFFAAKASWDARNQRVKPGYTSEYLNTFTQPVANESTDNMTSFWLNRVKRNLMAFVPYYIPNSLIDPDNASFKLRFPEEDRRWVPGILVIAFMLAGLLSMKRLSLLLILYFLATFGSLMLYPPYYADIRYFIPLLPLMLAALVAGVCWTAHWIAQRLSRYRKEPAWLDKGMTPVLALLMLALLLPTYRSVQEYYRKFAAVKTFDQIQNHRSYQVYLDECVKCALLPDHWVFVARKPEIFYFHSKYHHAVSMPKEGTPAEIVRYLEDNEVSALVLDAVYRTSAVVIMPTIQAYPHLFTVLWREDDGSGAVVGFIPNMNK